MSMASNGSSGAATWTALAAIPENLRGVPWLTISELALVARVSEPTLNSALKG